MSQITLTMVIYLFLHVLLSLFRLPFVYSTPNSFSLKLIHRDSPNSPLYQPNLSNFLRFKKHVEISISRASYFQRPNEIEKRDSNVSLRLILNRHQYLFTVDLGLGTPVVRTTLIFDTGSGITWTQCRPCISCFKQNKPLFNGKNSTSYTKISRSHKLSKQFMCSPFGCFYHVLYYSGQFSSGLASLESFTFRTTAGGAHKVKDLVFGCGSFNGGSFSRDNAITGILGMDKSSVSFARQLGGLIKDRFSYCLPMKTSNNNINKDSYLRFGEEAIIRGTNARRTPFYTFKQRPNTYGLSLVDISIGGQRLGLKRDTFIEGCVIDSGASVGLLSKTAFYAVEKSFRLHFSKFKNIKRFYRKDIPREMVCYTRPKGFMNFVNLTYHFKGADFHVRPENLFMYDLDPNFFCMAIIESKTTTILGAYQQQNMRIVYDLKEEVLSFAPEDCSKDAA